MPKFFFIVILLSNWLSPRALSLQNEDPVVRAVLFYSPTCGHCQYVIDEVLPPLFEKYGNQLQMIGIDASQPGAGDVYRAVLQKFNLDRGGVPALVIDDQLLIGSVDIPAKFPGLIEQYLAQGGVDWPDIPGIEAALSAVESTQASATLPVTDQVEPSASPTDFINQGNPVSTESIAITPIPGAINLVSEHDETNVWDRIARDLWGNILAIVVLVGMLASLIGILMSPGRNLETNHVDRSPWLIPLLCVLGLGVAGYLAFVETNEVTAFCGPIGDCNTVQQSEYARLFGVLPIGILGLMGYILMGIAWAISRFGKEQVATLANLLLFLMSLFGVLFSIYLTFLEPFVIGATCAWCLTSAILMTVLLWLTAPKGIQAWKQLQVKASP